MLLVFNLNIYFFRLRAVSIKVLSISAKLRGSWSSWPGKYLIFTLPRYIFIYLKMFKLTSSCNVNPYFKFVQVWRGRGQSPSRDRIPPRVRKLWRSWSPYCRHRAGTVRQRRFCRRRKSLQSNYLTMYNVIG